MAITAEYLREVGAVVLAAPSLREAAAIWRKRDPVMRVVVVDAMDMRDETTALCVGQRRIYLASSNGHCWSLTDQPSTATALILTED